MFGLINILIVFFVLLIGYQIVSEYYTNKEGIDDTLEDMTLKEEILEEVGEEVGPLLYKADGEPQMILSRLTKLEDEVKGLVQTQKDKANGSQIQMQLDAEAKEGQAREKERKAEMKLAEAESIREQNEQEML
jgi:hypothetical protein